MPTKESPKTFQLSTSHASGTKLEKMWGRRVVAKGYLALPNLLVRYLVAEGNLGLKPYQQALLFQLLSFWWGPDYPVIPKKSTLAKRLNISARQVQRHLRILEERGLIEITRRKSIGGRYISNEYTFFGLVQKLKNLEISLDKEERDRESSKNTGPIGY